MHSGDEIMNGPFSHQLLEKSRVLKTKPFRVVKFSGLFDRERRQTPVGGKDVLT